MRLILKNAHNYGSIVTGVVQGGWVGSRRHTRTDDKDGKALIRNSLHKSLLPDAE